MGTEGSRFYESIVVLQPTLNNDENLDVFEKISEFIVCNNGRIIERTTLGVLGMAYVMKKFKNGYFMFFRFESPTSFINNLELFYKRDERIIRSIICRLDKEGQKYNDERYKKKGKILDIIEKA